MTTADLSGTNQQEPRSSTGVRWPKRGDKMRFLGENGYPFQLEDAKKIFEVGRLYEVAGCSVGDWEHSIAFVGIDGHFNGVMFELAEPTDARVIGTPEPKTSPGSLKPLPTESWRSDMENAPRDRSPVIVACPSKHDPSGYVVGEAYFNPDSFGGEGAWWWAGTFDGEWGDNPIIEIQDGPPEFWRPPPASPLPTDGEKD